MKTWTHEVMHHILLAGFFRRNTTRIHGQQRSVNHTKEIKSIILLNFIYSNIECKIYAVVKSDSAGFWKSASLHAEALRATKICSDIRTARKLVCRCHCAKFTWNLILRRTKCWTFFLFFFAKEFISIKFHIHSRECILAVWSFSRDFFY